MILRLREKLSIWRGLSLYYKWELVGVYLHLRCSACGDWFWNKDPCYADGHNQ